jgi:hypothetical protein
MTSRDSDDAPEQDASTVDDAPGMRFEMLLFGVLTLFLVVAGAVYYAWSDEWAGTILLVLAGGLAGIAAGYFYLQDRLERGDVANAGELGPAPVAEPAAIHASIWPLEMGGGMTITFLGLVLSRMIVLLGLVLMLHAVVGWIAQSRSGH